MLKLLFAKCKAIQKHCQKLGFILILFFCLCSLLSLSFYSIAKPTTKNISPASIKNTLMETTAVNTVPINHLITAKNTSSYNVPVTNNELLPTALPNQLPSSKITANTTSEFPSELPTSIENIADQPDNINTPEYVIIRASDQATFSSETTAHVALLTVKEGSYFKMNDILLELDCREQQAELKKAEAEQQSMNAAKKSAEKLQSYGSISEYELIKAKSDADASNADVDKLKAIVDKCIIKAPFNGAVSELMVHTYETVKPGDPLLKIVNTDNLELQMQIPSLWLQWIKIGTRFNVHVTEINKLIAAKVIKINPQIDSVSQTVKITGIIIQYDPDLRPGMSGQANFPENPDKKEMKSIN